jgi:hypothetical protein
MTSTLLLSSDRNALHVPSRHAPAAPPLGRARRRGAVRRRAASTERSGAAVLDEMTRVLAGDAPPGMRIPQEEEVAAVLGVSIVPVREALKTLVGQGLVEHASSGAAAFSWFIGAIVAFLIHWGLSRSRAATSV